MSFDAVQVSKLEPNASKLFNNIYLIGFMGAGKTSIGRVLASELGALHLDTDQLIEYLLGKSIREIFKTRGEAFFRDTETQLLKYLAAQPAGTCIVSTGGGIVERPENMALMHNSGLIVFLDISAEEAWRRLCRVQDRPLLNTPDPGITINELLKKRRPLYQEADVTVETTNRSIKNAVEIIISKTGKWKNEKEKNIGTPWSQP